MSSGAVGEDGVVLLRGLLEHGKHGMIYSYWCTSAIGDTYTPTGMSQYSQLKLTCCSGRMLFYIFFPRRKNIMAYNI